MRLLINPFMRLLKHMRKLVMLTALMLLVPAVSQAKTLDELLVEKGVITKGQAAKSAGTPGSVHYNKGVRWEFADKKVTGQLSTLIRSRYTFVDFDKDDAARDQNISSFDVTDARLIATGTALDKEFSYKLEGDFVANGTSAALKDAYIQWNACDWVAVGMGQKKTGVSRQFNTSEQNLTFPDRSIASDFFSLGREAGAWLKFTSPELPVEITAAITNGESDGEGINRSGVDTKHTGVVNVRYNSGDINPYVESDVDGTEDLAWSVGAAFAAGQSNSDFIDSETSGAENADIYGANVDFILKTQGLSVAAEYYYQSVDSDQLADEVRPQGGYVQAGYFLVPGEFELAARYSMVDCDENSGVSACRSEDGRSLDVGNGVDVAANYYFNGNELKAQLVYAMLNEDVAGADGDDINTDRIIVALTGLF